MGGSSLHVEDEVENLYVAFRLEEFCPCSLGASSLLHLLKIKRKTSQKVKELARKKLSALTKSNLE